MSKETDASVYSSVVRFVVYRRRAMELREVIRTFWSGPYQMRVFRDGGISVGAVNQKLIDEVKQGGKLPKPPVFRDRFGNSGR